MSANSKKIAEDSSPHLSTSGSGKKQPFLHFYLPFLIIGQVSGTFFAPCQPRANLFKFHIAATCQPAVLEKKFSCGRLVLLKSGSNTVAPPTLRMPLTLAVAKTSMASWSVAHRSSPSFRSHKGWVRMGKGWGSENLRISESEPEVYFLRRNSSGFFVRE